MDGDKRKDKGALQAPLLSVGGTPSCWASHVLTAPDTFPIKGAQSTHPPLTALPHPPLPLLFFYFFSFFPSSFISSLVYCKCDMARVARVANWPGLEPPIVLSPISYFYHGPIVHLPSPMDTGQGEVDEDFHDISHLSFCALYTYFYVLIEIS